MCGPTPSPRDAGGDRVDALGTRPGRTAPGEQHSSSGALHDEASWAGGVGCGWARWRLLLLAKQERAAVLASLLVVVRRGSEVGAAGSFSTAWPSEALDSCLWPPDAFSMPWHRALSRGESAGLIAVACWLD